MESARPAVDLALQALELFRAGDIEAGTDAYRRALEVPGQELPVGIHLMQLSGTGLSEAARRVEALALTGNGDISLAWAVHRLGSPAVSAADYEQLIAAGRANARMVHRYMICLSLIGDSARLAAVAAPDVLFRRTALQVDGSVDALLIGVRAALRGAANRKFYEVEYSARNLDRVHKTHLLDDPAVVEIHSVIRRQVALYLKEITQSGHMMASRVPEDFELRSWAVISDGTGHLVPHIHHGCWVIGVAYIEGEDPIAAGRGEDGLLRIGAAVEGDAGCAGWPVMTVAPTPGTLVLMPAFYTHWVVPLQSAAPRISLAFNVVEVRST